MGEFPWVFQKMAVNAELLRSQTELPDSVESTIIPSLDMLLIEESHCHSCLDSQGSWSVAKLSGKVANIKN